MEHFTMERTSYHLEKDVKEITIPLSYGHIAAREWGEPNGDSCLAIHGWQENAGSFDTLIPHLSSNLYIIAIDLLGHGLSSHKPIGSPYFYLEFVYHVKYIADYFKWNKFTIIGHSFGSSIGLVFSSLFPNLVEKLVCIDLMKPFTYPISYISGEIKSTMEMYIEAEKKTDATQPSYCEDEVIKRIINSRNGDISIQSAQILSKRGAKKLGNGKLVFSRDIRLKTIWSSGLNYFDIMAEILSGITCHLLIIKAKGSTTYSDEVSLNAFLDMYKKQCSSFQFVEVDGNHFVHLDHPELVAPFINQFVQNKHSTL